MTEIAETVPNEVQYVAGKEGGDENYESVDRGETSELQAVSVKAAIQELGQHTSSVVAVLQSFEKGYSQPNSVDLRAALETLQNEENLMFTDIPSYVQIELASDKQKNAKYNSKIAPRTIAPQDPPIRDYSQTHNVFVSPQVPLQMPFNYQQFLAENPEWKDKEGTYHDLFYGDGSNCPFTPPENNKRIELEKARADKFVPEKRDPPSYEPAPMRQLKVQADFVPACALRVDHSDQQQRLRELKAQRIAIAKVEK